MSDVQDTLPRARTRSRSRSRSRSTRSRSRSGSKSRSARSRTPLRREQSRSPPPRRRSRRRSTTAPKRDSKRQTTLLKALNDANAIETMTDTMYRGVAFPSDNVELEHPGHWWAVKKEIAENYAETFSYVDDGTIFVGKSKQPLLFVKFKNVFDCGPVDDYVMHDDGRPAHHRISDPKLKEEFREFGDAPFLKELRRLMMFADDNLACDEFVIHKSKGLKLDKNRFAGLSLLCDGDPYTVGNRNDEYWLMDPAQSFEVIETETYESTG